MICVGDLSRISRNRNILLPTWTQGCIHHSALSFQSQEPSQTLTLSNGPENNRFISKLKECLLYRADLDVRDRDVEELVHIRKPNHPNICHNHCPQIALVAEKYRFIFCPFSSKVWSSQKGWWTSPWEIPNPIYGGDNLLQGQQLQATSLYHHIKSVIWFKF